MPGELSYIATSTFCTYDRLRKMRRSWVDLRWSTLPSRAIDARWIVVTIADDMFGARWRAGIRVGCFERDYAGASITMPSARPATAMRSSYVTTARRST